MIEKIAMRAVPAVPEISRQAISPALGAGPATETAAADFGAMLTSMLASTVETIRAGEAASIAGIRGQASVQEVAEAVMSAEQTLHAGIAIRDKVVAAYLELSRMQI